MVSFKNVFSENKVLTHRGGKRKLGWFLYCLPFNFAPEKHTGRLGQKWGAEYKWNSNLQFYAFSDNTPMNISTN